MPTAELLTTGWEPGTDNADSFCRRWVHHWADQCEAFALAAGGTSYRDARYALADYGRPSGMFNAATLLAHRPTALTGTACSTRSRPGFPPAPVRCTSGASGRRRT